MNFYDELQKYFEAHNINKTREFLESSLEDAIKNHNTSLIIEVLNELIGFLRDITSYEDSYKYANALKRILDENDIDPKSLFISYINIANSFRANKLYNESISLLNKAISIYNENKLSLHKELAALYNNASLAYQGLNDYSKAEGALFKALELIKNDINPIKLGTTYVNISTNYLLKNDLIEAKKYLELASNIFEANNKDFHFGGYAAAYARYYKLKGDDIKSINYYERAISNIWMHTGKNQYYKELLDELFTLYKKNNIDPHIMGLELSREYFESVKASFFSEIKDLKEYITVGLFGLGSECFECDDIISEDHDFDPGFIVLVSPSVIKSDFDIIARAYNNLDKCYKRYYIANLDKKGVHYEDKYILDFLGGNKNDFSKALITNGELFYVGAMTGFEALRNKIIKDERYNFIPKLIYKTLEINQYLPYNLNRALERDKKETYNILKYHLIDRLIEYYYIYHLEFQPHDKLAFEMMGEDSIIKKWIRSLLNDDLNIFEEVSASLLKILHSYHIINSIDTIYIEDYKEELLAFLASYKERRGLINQIVSIEWDMFKELKNTCGDATCQRNPKYFRLMRESQYFTWSINTLKSYLSDLNIALENGYNTLAIKYGFMEEGVSLDHFLSIKDNLPKLSEKQKALIDEVSRVILNERISFDEINKYGTMRNVFSVSDDINSASYETYLKGELSSYSENTLYLYSRDIVSIINSGLNPVELIIKYTILLRVDEKL